VKLILANQKITRKGGGEEENRENKKGTAELFHISNPR